MSLINWEEAEKYTSWAMQKNDPATSWDKGADGWQKRIAFESSFTKAQVDACTRITKDKTVLDACCGTGRTAIPFAKKAKHVYAVDAGPAMLEHCRNNAKEEGLDNISVIQIDNWHSCQPGKEFPIVDIAVSVIGPPQADILNFSKFAKEYCYFLSFTGDPYRAVMKELFEGTNDSVWGAVVGNSKGQRPVGPSVPPLVAASKRTDNCALNIQFNILYDHGAFPEVTYAKGAWSYEAQTKDEVYAYLRTLGSVDEDKYDVFKANCDKRIEKTQSGLYRYAYPSAMYVLGWDPNELR